ncbi:Zn-ribbon domain-containing OB-fold protein [Rhodococcus sp. C26F]
MTAYGDRDSSVWWKAISEHSLLVQQCAACATLRWAPRALCPECGSFEWEWRPTDGTGTIVSWTVSHRAFLPDRSTPFTVVLVRLNCAQNLLVPGSWSGDPVGTDLTVGMPVQARFSAVQPNPAEPQTIITWTGKPPHHEV